MQVILTPTAVADLFGPGLNGFKGDVPPLPPPTQVSAEWLNSVQMELVNAIVSQGYALDGLNYSQLTTAINNWSFSGSPEIISGATLAILSGAALAIKDGGTFQVESNGEVYFDAGSISSFSGDLTFPIGSSTTFEVGSSLVIDTITAPLTIAATGSDTGVLITATDGNAAVFTNDTTTPARAPIVITPQDKDATNLQTGSLAVNSARGNLLRHYDGIFYRTLHSSPKGRVYGLGVSVSSTLLSGASIDLSPVTILPEEVGDVEVTVTGHLDWSSDTASTTIQLRDNTAGLTINGGGAGVVEYPIVGAIGRDHSIVARVRYTVPGTGNRTFNVRLTAAGGTTTYTDITVSVRGVL